MTAVLDTVTGKGARDAGRAAERGAQLDADAQTDALDYLKERERLPRQYSESALTRLNDIYSGGSGQQKLLEQAKASPLYSTLLGQGEDAVLRNASATGGLRSGSAQSNLADNSQRALLQSYNQQLQGIQGMAGLPSNANNIASMTAGIGRTLGQGQIAKANAVQRGNENMTNLALQGGMMAFSDIRAKDNIKFTGVENGHRIYQWTWNKAGEVLGLKGKGRGVMAHEIYKKNPEAIDVKLGFLMVNYQKLGLSEYLEAS